MRYISKKLVRLTIMDALDRVLRREKNVLSRNTIMTIISAADTISENVQQDFISRGDTVSGRQPKNAASKTGRKVQGRAPAAKKKPKVS